MAHVDSRELRRIAFVTARYHELQGLIPATFGALLLFGAITGVIAGPPRRLSDALQALSLPMNVMVVPCMTYLHGSYRRTFGDVVARWHQSLLAGLPALIVMAGGVVDMALELEGTRSRPSLAAMALAAYSTSVLIRDWPWRPHQLIAAAAGMAGVLVTGAVPAAADRWGSDPARAEAYLLAYVLMGAAMIATGLLDHHLLARSMASREIAVSPAPASRIAPLKRAYVATAFIAAAAIPLSLPDNWLPAFPLTLAIAFLLAMMFLSGVKALQAVKDLGRPRSEPAPTGTVLDFAPIELGIFAVFALAAAAQFTIARGQPALLLAVTITAATACASFGAVRRRRFYRLTALAMSVALVPVTALSPARGALVLVLNFGAASLADAAIDLWTTWRSDHDHAHTV